MIDLHTHIIDEIDDGSRSFLESISILKKMQKIGFKVVVATPHYITGSKFLANNQEKMEKLNRIKEVLEEKDISVKLCLGNEVFIDPNILSLMHEGEILSIHGSNYILIELPVSRMMNDLFTILFQIRAKGYIPIIAHPERYLFLQEDHDLILKFLEMGCLFQGNFENIVGKYGKHAKKLFLHMLKQNQYQFLATDVHHKEDILFKNFKKVKRRIIRLTSKKNFKELTETNPLKVLRNEKIEVQLENK